MGTSERPRQNMDDLSRIVDYLRLGAKVGLINNFVIDGPVKNEPTIFRDFICISNSTPGEFDQVSLKAITTHNSSIIEIYDRILKLTLPERVKNLKIPTSVDLRDRSKIRASLLNMPYIVFAFGQIRSTKEDVVSMFCIVGMSPEEAFAEVQYVARSRKTSFN